MAASFFFYDLETSGFSSSAARIMQFAGQRTSLDMKPIGEPINFLIKLSPDVLPDPDAIMLTGITPQMTLQDGLTEAEFLTEFYKDVAQPNTIFLGYNSVRFDDEFMRFLNYRNFYDAYEWQWQNGASRWDLLDVVRMTRALRPAGLNWPVDSDGKPSNRLEMLSTANKLNHTNAHDALSDVQATIAVANLLKQKQPELFNYLFEHRSKKAVAEVVQAGQPFVYTSGRYGSEFKHTTAVVLLAMHPKQDAALVYDLRYDPAPFMAMTPAQLAEAWRFKKERDVSDLQLPVKTLKYNRCPAVAPLGVIKDKASQTSIQLTLDDIANNLAKLKANRVAFAANVAAAIEILDSERQAQRAQPTAAAVSKPEAGAKLTSRALPDANAVDNQLYDGFFSDQDRTLMRTIRVAKPAELSQLADKLKDLRLQQLLPLYKARNYPESLTSEERASWEKHISNQLLAGGPASRMANYFRRLQELAQTELTSTQQFSLEELQLYGESIIPGDVSGLDGDQSALPIED